MYRGVLDETSVENFSKCRSLNGRSVIVDWNVNAFDGNEIDVEEVSSNDILCASPGPEQKAVFNHGMSHNQVHLACQKLGGVRIRNSTLFLSYFLFFLSSFCYFFLQFKITLFFHKISR